ncbi:MAG: hypothetical protein IJY71_04660 [Clostridia bacterium]|nr:hypothetical protein [Clostridia bacterium]
MKKIVILGCENSHADAFLRFLREKEAFYGLLSGKAQTESYEAFASPVFIMNAIDRSLRSGKEELVGRMEI